MKGGLLSYKLTLFLQQNATVFSLSTLLVLLQVRTGMVTVSDGKARPQPMRMHLSLDMLSLQREEVDNSDHKPAPLDSRVSLIGLDVVGCRPLSGPFSSTSIRAHR